MTILVTGGAGFIGSNFVLGWMDHSDEAVVNLDKLTYAGNPANLVSIEKNQQYAFVHGDIGDSALIHRLLAEHQPRAILNFAAESHVDRSIHGPGDFIENNIFCNFSLLDAVRANWSRLSPSLLRSFSFLHLS